MRGPMIAEVTAGWRTTNATAIWMRVSLASAAGAPGASAASSLAALAGVGGVVGRGEALSTSGGARPTDSLRSLILTAATTAWTDFSHAGRPSQWEARLHDRNQTWWH